MRRQVRTAFRFHKIRLIHRTKHVELWEGFAQDRSQIVKRFLTSRSHLWTEYLQQNRLKHPLLLQPHLAGYQRNHFCVGMPVEFVPEPMPHKWDMSVFAVQLLSLADALSAKKLIFRWDADSILLDRKTGKIFLAGLNSIRTASKIELEEQSTVILSRLMELVSKHHAGSANLEKTLRQWTRRKYNLLRGCLLTLLQQSESCLEQLPVLLEWHRSKELELVTGLFHLAEHSKGRAIVFQADPGEGKSTLLKQIYCDLLPRNCYVTFLASSKEERPHRSFNKLLQSFAENVGLNKSEFLKASTEEKAIENFLDAVTRVYKRDRQVCVFLIDDFHHFDSASVQWIGRLLKQIHSHPILFVFTARVERLELPDSVVSLAIHPAPVTNFVDSCNVPFWKEKQRKSYLEQVYQRTWGNPLLFEEYFREVIRQRQPTLTWEDGEWFFSSNEIPNLPDALIEFYRKRIPHLTEEEQLFLQKASVQGERFDAELVEQGAEQREVVLQSLIAKGLLTQSSRRFRFRKPLLAEAFYKQMETKQLSAFHRSLAEELLKKKTSDLWLTIARHFLKGGDYSGAFQLGRRTIQEMGNGVEPSILSLYEALLPHSAQLTDTDEIHLHQEMGELYSRRGRYPAAAACFSRALSLTKPESEERFWIAIRLAESHLLNHDILLAHKILQEQDPFAKNVTDSRHLLQYYFAKGSCSWHRGLRDDRDFNQAFTIAEKLEDYHALAQGYRQQAILFLRDGRLGEARSCIRKSLLFAERIQDAQETGHGLRTLASIAWRESKHKMAERLLRRSLRAFKAAGNSYGTACVWSLLGNVFVERCRFTDALDSFQKALTLFSKLDHPHEVTLAQFNLGLVYLEQGHLKEAEKIFLRCRQIDKKAGNKLFFAYDVRALGVLCMMRGFHKRAGKFLKRTIEICEELQAHGDLIQTRMIFLFNELQRKNYKDCRILVDFLQQQLPVLQEPMARAEIHYLVAHYCGMTQQHQKAFQCISESLQIAKPIHHHKLIGQNLILRLILKNKLPERNDPDLMGAIKNFRLSQNELESASYFLMLYQAYPPLLREQAHRKRLVQMEKIFRRVQHRPKHRILRQLAAGAASREVPVKPYYDWWQEVLQLFHGPHALEIRLRMILRKLSDEIHASFSLFQYLNESGIYEKITEPDNSSTNIIDGLPSQIFDMMLRRKESICVDPGSDAKLSRTPWVIIHEVRSCLAVPVLKGEQLLGVWYFERRGQDPSFLTKDLHKIRFFSIAAAPALESVLNSEFSERDKISIVTDVEFEDMIARSKAMQHVFRQMAKVAGVDISVLILGESGTGKELVARNLHRHSRRASGPFLALNCSALPDTLIESELFGFVRGAFTGATAAKPGLIEKAHGGTLFLDEIGDLSDAAQAKLLRVIQEREIQRLGDTSSRKVDVRFLFATHKNLKKLVEQNQYREDLFYRMSVHVLSIPPLRERKEDIPLLLTHFRKKYGGPYGKETVSFSAATMKVFGEYAWPGNIREMENVVQSLLINSEPHQMIEPEDLPSHFTRGSLIQKLSGLSLEEGKEQFEKEFILHSLEKNRWNKTQTARDLKVSRQGLINMIQRLGIKQG